MSALGHHTYASIPFATPMITLRVITYVVSVVTDEK